MTKNILLIGQNFTGKSNLLRHLAKGRIRQQYYPGTRVQINSGDCTINKKKYRLIEAPGIYTLIPTSENEIAALKLIMDFQPEKIIFVTNEAALETSLLIMIQLAELGIPFIVNYQVADTARQEYFFDKAKLTHIFNTEVVVSIQTIDHNIKGIQKALASCHKPRWVGSYSRSIEKTLKDFEKQFRHQISGNVSPRFICLMLLLGNQDMYSWVRRNYASQLSTEILAYAQERYSLANSFSLANRWESLANNLFQDIWHKPRVRGLRLSYFFEKYSLRFFWDLLIAGLALFIIFAFINVAGNKILVQFFYNELLGKYIMPALSRFFTQFCGNNLVTDFFVGGYGILTTGLTYAFAILLPLMASFFFIYTLLDNTGYINRLSLTLNRLLKLFRLNGYALPALLCSCCKITALQKSRTLHTKKEQIITVLLLLFGIPCVTQLIVILNLLWIIPAHYILIFVSVMLAQMLIILTLYSLKNRKPVAPYVSRVTPLHFPDLHKVLSITWLHIRWYTRTVIPLILLISVLLWLTQTTGLLDQLKNLITPLIGNFLDLPPAFTDSIILGLFRKDFGAVSLYDLANNGMLNSIQVLVSTLFIALSMPCLGFAAELYKQNGWRKMLLIFIASTTYAFTIAAIVNKILRV